MAANGVWSSPTSPSAGRHDNDNLDDDREAMLARLSKELAGNTRQSHDENNGDHIINNNNISHHDNQNLAHQNLFSGLLERHTISDQETPSLSSSSDEDDFLPELSVALSDPEGCRFEELLYWVSRLHLLFVVNLCLLFSSTDFFLSLFSHTLGPFLP